jgi:hypothetical protein
MNTGSDFAGAFPPVKKFLAGGNFFAPVCVILSCEFPMNMGRAALGAKRRVCMASPFSGESQDYLKNLKI